MTAYGDKLWEPSSERREASRMLAFAKQLGAKANLDLTDYPALHRHSIDDLGGFWAELASFTGVKWRTPARAAYEPPPPGRMRGARWFVGARLNFAENLLPETSDEAVIIALAEGPGGLRRRVLSARELRDQVTRCAAALAHAGIMKGDRVAGVLGNVPEALIAMLATTSLGAIWSSCSPDFGVDAVVDRLGQVAPKVVLFTKAYFYNGKRFACDDKIESCLARLPMVQRAVFVDHLDQSAERHGSRLQSFAEFLEAPSRPLSFEPMAFDDPVYVMFSSGTTGVPKCITHGVGGTLLQHNKELALHTDLRPGSRLLFYTTCGWMMWNWMASALSVGASLVLYEGSVSHPDLGALWRVVRDEKVTAFGTSPKFLGACMAAGPTPRELLGDAPLQSLLSTGAPLLPEQFRWVYERVATDLHLASISGGTDILSCFMLGNPLMPVHAGEIQYAGLGMAIEAWDELGQPLTGQKGELVCVKPFVSMPVHFWNDPDGRKYDKAYFEHFAEGRREVWRHGDFIEITARGGIIVYGRSDATLNPGGVRIGTAELYRQVETLKEVADSLAIGRRTADGDTEIVLFVKLAGQTRLDEALIQRIKTTIRSALTPRHVPSAVIGVQDIPYTRSGKKVELAVTQAIHGEPVSNLAALANPESMEEYFAMGARVSRRP